MRDLRGAWAWQDNEGLFMMRCLYWRFSGGMAFDYREIMGDCILYANGLSVFSFSLVYM